jgi:ribosomal protein S18 acetylase RimI-like enzyme
LWPQSPQRRRPTTYRTDRIIGEMHAYTPPLLALQHVLTDLTIAVLPEGQGIGIGRRLFERFLQAVPQNIARVELYTRECNARNVAFYERLGFLNEGCQRHKICMPGTGEFANADSHGVVYLQLL